MSAVRGLRTGFGFNSWDTYIRAPYGWFGNRDFTIAVWLYHSRNATDTILCSCGAAPGGTGYFIIVHEVYDTFFWGSRASNTNNFYGIRTASGAPWGRWTHFALRRRGTIVNAFVDGVKDSNYASVPLSEEFTYQDVCIGIRTWHPGWHGLLGPLVFYERALSDSEIAMLRDGLVPRDGLALYFDPSIPLRADGRVEDLSGNGRHGTVIGPVRVGVYRAARTVAPARVLPRAR